MKKRPVLYNKIATLTGGRVAEELIFEMCIRDSLQAWLLDGMSMGSAAAFMITGPSTKITNLGALKIVLGLRNFILYLAFVMVFSFITGLVVNILV